MPVSTPPLSFLGANCLRVIMHRIVDPTPIIGGVYAYPRRDQDMTRLVLHVVSDDGEKNAIVKRLILRAHTDFSAHYGKEHMRELPHFVWTHGGPSDKVPNMAQVVYARRD